MQNTSADSPFQPHVRHLFERLADRLCWASAYPDFSFADAIDAFRRFGFDEALTRRICRDNCLRLLRDHVDTDLEGFGDVN